MAERAVAFLRGMNLGRRRITNEELAQHFASAGFEDATPYQASGNVVFNRPRGPDRRAGDPNLARLEARLESHLEERLGYEVATFIRTMPELKHLVQLEEPPAAEKEGFTVHVLFMRTEAPPGLARQLETLETADDRLRLMGRDVLWLRRGRLKDSTLDLSDTDTLTGGLAHTMRTIGTVRRIVKKFG